METVTLTKDNVLSAHRNGGPEFKKGLEHLLPELFGDITQRIKTIDDVYAVVRSNPGAYLPQGITLQQYTVHPAGVIELIAAVLNEDWVPDYGNASQGKFWPIFQYIPSAPLGFSCLDYGYDGAATYLGARLCYKSRVLAEYAATQFRAEYNKFLSRN